MKRVLVAQHWLAGLAIAACISGINLFIWQMLGRHAEAPAHEGRIGGITYNGAKRWHSPLEGEQPSAKDMEEDFAQLARHTQHLRTYSVSDVPDLPRIAHQHGLEVLAGAWLDNRLDANQRELNALLNLARAAPNVKRVLVGNETQLKALLPPNRLMAYLDQARHALRDTGVQVSTAEPWHVWLAQPQLAQHVDYIAIHVLPYWERVPIEDAVQVSLANIARVQTRFPHHRVVVTEIGWPSNGPSLGEAHATAANQAWFLRTFLQHAKAQGLDHYLLEAFDQPWKMSTEGRAGAYWGLWDTWRNPKFAWSGPVASDPYGQQKAWIGSALGFMMNMVLWTALAQMSRAGRMAFCVATQSVVSLGVILMSIPLAHYLTAADLIGLALISAALAFISATLLAQAFEFCDRMWPGPASSEQQPTGTIHTAVPFISIHVACANEPPDMVIQTVESLLAMDWPAFEIIVVDNNTVEASAREQLAAWMANRNDARLRFAQWAHLPGYKAGALNQALAMTNPAAEWVAVVDADYLVDAQWFMRVRMHFDDATVGVIQAPQAHRNWSSRMSDRMKNWETEGFFRIGMHHRHARNAIIQHGTMTLVRAAALRRLMWNERCICEDTELGLRMLNARYRAVYVPEVLGAGLLPRDFAAYAQQRKRWALGAMQIFRQHASALLGRSSLTSAQRYHFLAGWLPWLGDALHLVFTLVMIVFSLGMVYFPSTVQPPLWLLTVPLVAFFMARLLTGPLLYARCVPCGWADRIGAAVAGMALSHRIARGVLQGLRHRHAVFAVTRKAVGSQESCATAGSTEVNMAGNSESGTAAGRLKGVTFVRGIGEEFALLASLLFCMCLLALSHDGTDAGRLGWMAILAMQSLPYWMALACRLIEILVPQGSSKH